MLINVLALLINQASKAAYADIDGVAGLLRCVLVHIFPYRAKVIDKNLARVFAGRTPAQVLAQRNAFYSYLSNLIAEILAGLQMSGAALSARVTFLDNADLLARIAAGKPLVGMPAHQANWEWLLNACAVQFPSTNLAVYQPL